MDLGIKGRTAIVCGASKGLGRACAEALAAEGVDLVVTARSAETLETTAGEIRKQFGVDVKAVAGDITTQAGVDATLAACPAPDILINNAGGPPVGDWRKFGREQWLAAAEGNMVTAIMLIGAVVDGMAERGFGRIINITSAVVKQPNPALGLSVAARLGLTGFAKSIAPAYVKSNVTINNLLPERFDTDRLRSNIAKLSGSSDKIDGRTARGPGQGQHRRPLRPGRGVRSGLRLLLQRPRRLPDRPERHARRRRLPRRVLGKIGALRGVYERVM